MSGGIIHDSLKYKDKIYEIEGSPLSFLFERIFPIGFGDEYSSPPNPEAIWEIKDNKLFLTNISEFSLLKDKVPFLANEFNGLIFIDQDINNDSFISSDEKKYPKFLTILSFENGILVSEKVEDRKSFEKIAINYFRSLIVKKRSNKSFFSDIHNWFKELIS